MSVPLEFADLANAFGGQLCALFGGGTVSVEAAPPDAGAWVATLVVGSPTPSYRSALRRWQRRGFSPAAHLLRAEIWRRLGFDVEPVSQFIWVAERL